MRPRSRTRRVVLPLALALASVSLLAAAARAEVAVPPVARVTDLTGTLSAAAARRIEERLASLETEKGSQLAVLILSTTQPEEIEAYALRVAEAWKLGRKGVDDGALLVVAQNDHRIRIEVGYGLEGALNDATCKRIIEDYMVPRMRAGEFDGAVETGVDRMIGVVRGEPLPTPPAHRGAGGTGTNPSPFGPLGTVVLVGGFGVAAVLRLILGRLAGGIAGGVGVAGLAALLGTPLPFALLFGGIVFAAVLLGGLGTRSGFYAGSGGFGGGFGGFGGGSGGGGGFSGGGGSFGGGGASGSW